MTAPTKLPACPLCGREPLSEWSHTVGSPQRFRVSCEIDPGHWLRVTKRTRADAIRAWRRLARGGEK